jgi:hypothetical protein
LAPNVTAGEVIDEALIIAELFVAYRLREVSTVLVRYRFYDGTEEGSYR